MTHTTHTPTARRDADETMTRVQTGWHDAARLSKPYWGPCWISWCRVDGAIAAVEEHDTEDEARAWCEREERIRAERRAP